MNVCPDPDPRPDTVGPPPSGCVRRQVLLGALGLGAVGVLSACGKAQSTAEPLPVAAGPAAGSVTPIAAAPPPAGPALSLGPAAAIPVKGGNVFDKDKVVVTQPGAGVYRAFSAVCTHEQCTVGDVDGGTVNCYCHGSKFSITDGSVVNGPADKPPATKTVTLTGGTLTVS